MSAIGSRRLERRVAGAWALVCFALLAIAFAFPGAEVLPFHLSWIGFVAIAVWFETHGWRTRVAAVALGIAWLVVGVHNVTRDPEGVWELIEIPIMITTYAAVLRLARNQRRAFAAERDRVARQQEMLRRVAHGLRTPVAVARGHVELAQRNVRDTAVASDLAVAVDELDRLGRTAQRLLVLAKSDARVGAPTDVDVEELVDEVMLRWATTVPRRWSTHVDTAGHVLADADGLREALDALIENAVAATHAASSIVVLATRVDDTLCLSVADDGPGIDVADPDRLFEPFETGVNGDGGDSGGGDSGGGESGAVHGTGLGLSIVRSVAQAHGGHARLVTSPGGGTVVTFSIECSAASGYSARGAADRQAGPTATLEVT